MKTTVRVGAVQLEASKEDIQANLDRAAPLVRDAAARGARMVLLPEFLPTGYDLSESIWQRGEPCQGPTVAWLKGQARTNGIWIGTSFLEASGSQFHNTFVLVDAEGREALRVTKSKPAASEAFLFAGRESARVADTPFGRVGVSICYEAAWASTMDALIRQGADFVLMPMSAPLPTLRFPLRSEDIREFHDALRRLASAVSRDLGVPAIMANKVGAWRTVPPWPFPREDSRFPGLSAITSAEGTVMAQLEDKEGVIVADITLDKARKATQLTSRFGKWARRPPRLFNLFVLPETWGSVTYSLSLRRRRVASATALRTQLPGPEDISH